MNTAIAPLFRRSFLTLVLGFIAAIAVSSLLPTPVHTRAQSASELVLSVLNPPTTFNYALNEESPNIFGYTYEGLVTENGIRAEIEPALAQSWDISEDKLRIVFTLRENLQWSDGKPLSADDVVFTYNDIYFNKTIPTSIRNILVIGEERILPTVRKLDDRRVEFTLPEPFAPFLRATGLAILPAHVLRESILTQDPEGHSKFLSTWGIDTPPDEIIVNGPYKLESYNGGDRLVFRRNPYYWRRDDRSNQQPYIDRIIWQILDSIDAELVKFRAGELDSINLRPEDFKQLEAEQKRGQFKIYKGGPNPGTTFITFNLNTGRRTDGSPLVNPIQSRWFNTVAFRQAIAHAIDRPTAIEKIFLGLGAPVNSSISPYSPYYLSPEKGLKVYDYNPDKAKKLLLGAGFAYNEKNELLDADGNRVRFTLITNAGNTIREAMGVQIQQDLSQIGIEVDFQSIPFPALIDKLVNSLDWDCHILGFTGSIEPNDAINIWLPEGRLHLFNLAPPPNQPPIMGWEVADWEREIADLYRQAARELDEEKRKVIYAETQRLTQMYLPMIPLVNQLSMTAVRDRVKGIQYSALNGAFWNIYELKIEE